MASGAVPVSAAVRSWFCAAGPPTSASGTLGVQLAAEPADEVGGALVVDGGRGGDADRDASVGGRWRGDPGVGHVGVGGGRGDDCRRVAGGGGDEDRGGGAGPEGGGDHVVAVAAGSALVDDARRRACRGASRGPGRPAEQQREAGGQGAAGPLQRRRRSSGPSGLRRPGRGPCPWSPGPGRRARRARRAAG